MAEKGWKEDTVTHEDVVPSAELTTNDTIPPENEILRAIQSMKDAVEESNRKFERQMEETITRRLAEFKREYRMPEPEPQAGSSRETSGVLDPNTSDELNIPLRAHHVRPPVENEIRITKDDRHRIRDVADTIPRYNGNNVEFNNFIRACRDAQGTIPPRLEKEFIQTIKPKIIGRARAAIEYTNYNTILELIDCLTRVLGPSKTLHDFYTELASLRLKPNEDMLDYLTRVKDLHENLLMAERRERGNAAATQRIEREVIKALIHGFPPGLRDAPRPEQFYSLGEAFTTIRDLIHVWQRDNSIFKSRPANSYNNEHRRNNNNNGRSYNNNQNQSSNIRYNYSNNPNIRESNNYSRNNDYRRNDNRDNYARYNNGYETRHDRRGTPPITRYDRDKYCDYCRRPGHHYNECRRRQNQNYENRNYEQRDLRNSGNARAPAVNQEQPRATTTATSVPQSRPITLIETTPSLNEESISISREDPQNLQQLQ